MRRPRGRKFLSLRHNMRSRTAFIFGRNLTLRSVLLNLGAIGVHILLPAWNRVRGHRATFMLNPVELRKIVFAAKHRTPLDEFAKNAADGEHVRGKRVHGAFVALKQQNLRRAIVSRHDMTAIGEHLTIGQIVCARQSKVGNLDASFIREQQILRLQIAVNVLVEQEKLESAQQIVHHRLDMRLRKPFDIFLHLLRCQAIALDIAVLLRVWLGGGGVVVDVASASYTLKMNLAQIANQCAQLVWHVLLH
mmetsp:Transcript_27768/g.45805  ORF Transcript_27768/g.45805 Transcript_27768/m.45805 type:complete len:249 (-) Transcript_27768:1844-2590(-)